MTSLSKSKGNAHEREVADILTKWHGQAFNRIPNSGALRWGNGVWTYGDILPPQDFPFVIECKHYASIEFDEVLGTNRKGPGYGLVTEWWYNQAQADAERACLETGLQTWALLIWKQNRRRIRLTLCDKLWRRLQVSDLVAVTTSIPGRIPYVTTDLEGFLERVTKQALIDYASQPE